MGKFKIKQLMDLNTGNSRLPVKNLHFVSEEIMAVRDLRVLMKEGLGKGFQMRGESTDAKWGSIDFKLVSGQNDSRKRSRCNDDVADHEMGSWPKRKKILAQINHLPSNFQQKYSVLSTDDSKNLGKSGLRAAMVNPRFAGETLRAQGKERLGRRKVNVDAENRTTKSKLKKQSAHAPTDFKPISSYKVVCQSSHGVLDSTANASKTDSQLRRKKMLGPTTASLDNVLPKQSQTFGETIELVNKGTESGSFLNDSQPKASRASNMDSDNSTKRALLSAMIKTRFAETILKAQERMILMEANKADIKRLDNVLPKQSDTYGEAIELVNKGAESGSFLNDSQPKASRASNMDSDNSTKRALRSAMIKTRFADTILKAQEKMILIQANKADMERLERRKAKTEAEIKAAGSKLKEQRKKEREAARIALEKMERTVEWNHALDVTQEFEKLISVKHSMVVMPFTRDSFQW